MPAVGVRCCGSPEVSPAAAPQAMSDSLMYRLAYYRFADAAERNTGRRGYDRVRNADIGLMDFKCAGLTVQY